MNPARSIARTFVPPLLALALAGAFAPASHAHDYRAGEVRIGHPYARPTPPGARVAGVWLKSLTNEGKTGDRLLRASTPVAERVEIHTMRMDGNVMRMRELGELALPPGRIFEMRPQAGEHLMLMELRRPLKAGDTFPLVLEFERSGRVEVRVDVEAGDASAGAAHGAGHGAQGTAHGAHGTAHGVGHAHGSGK